MKSLALLKWLAKATALYQFEKAIKCDADKANAGQVYQVQYKEPTNYRAELAKATGTSPTYLRQIAHGWRRPSMELAARIAKASEAWQGILPVITRESLHKEWTKWR